MEKESENEQIAGQVEEFLGAWLAMRQQIQALNFNRAHQHGLSTTQFMVLALLEETRPDQPITISGLAARMNLDPATVVRSVDSLENRGLVERRRDKKDRRVVFVEFSAEGRQTQRAMQQTFKSRLAAIFEAMTEEGRAGLLKGLHEFAAVSNAPQPQKDEQN